MMEPLPFLFVMSLLLTSSAQTKTELSHFLSVTVGDNITLACFYREDVMPRLYWYKQSLSLGKKPTLVSTFYKYNQVNSFYGEFYNNHRFSLDNQNEKNDLKIQNVQISDSAVYFCASSVLHQLEILESVTVIVNGLNTGVEVHQSSAENTDPGASVTLKCTVHTGSCDGAHGVYWFKKTEDSHAGVLYSHGGSRDQCERNTDSQSNSCVYNLPIHNVRSEQTGTYYCAVVSCGQVLFGNGTRVSVKSGVDSIVYVLTGALVFTSVLVGLLVISFWTMQKKYRRLSAELKCISTFSAHATTNAEVGEADNLHYAALSVNQLSRRQRNTDASDCVYSSVQHTQSQ